MKRKIIVEKVKYKGQRTFMPILYGLYDNNKLIKTFNKKKDALEYKKRYKFGIAMGYEK